MSATETPSIERFVRGTLGCRCPDEVFASIRVEQQAEAGTPFVRLLVGERLLIYVLHPRPGPPAAALVTALAARGRAERDACGYNRFRLVVAGDARDPAGAEIPERFAAAAGEDPHAHLHLVAPDLLPAALRPG